MLPGNLQGKRYLVMGALGLLLILSAGSYSLYRQKVLSFSSVPANFEQAERKPLPKRIVIPSLRLEKGIDPTQIVNGVWQIPDTSAAFLATSARPGEKGNIVIYGHNKKVIFGPLAAIKINDTVTLVTEDGTEYGYKVESIEKVKPDRIDLVSPTDFEVLTIYTCTGLFDSERFVIKAKPESVRAAENIGLAR